MIAARFRIFDGKKYLEMGTFDSKSQAKKAAQSWRKEGRHVRVVKVKSARYPYQIFVKIEDLKR